MYSFLTGKYTKESIPADSNLHNKSIVNLAQFDKNWKIVDEVVAISKEINRTPAQVIKF